MYNRKGLESKGNSCWINSLIQFIIDILLKNDKEDLIYEYLKIDNSNQSKIYDKNK